MCLEQCHEWKFSYERSDGKRQQLLSFTASFSFDVLRASQDTKREAAHGLISFFTSEMIYLQTVGRHFVQTFSVYIFYYTYLPDTSNFIQQPQINNYNRQDAIFLLRKWSNLWYIYSISSYNIEKVTLDLALRLILFLVSTGTMGSIGIWDSDSPLSCNGPDWWMWEGKENINDCIKTSLPVGETQNKENIRALSGISTDF